MAALRARGVRVSASGGYPGARRRVVTAMPAEVPEAAPTFSALYAAGAVGETELRAAAQAVVGAGRLGDSAVHQDGVTILVLGSLPPQLLTMRVGGAAVPLSEARPDLAFGGSQKQQPAVVPSLRVDVLGARAFGVSRAYFAKGVAAGKVTVNGVKAGKAASADEGDEVYAEGLGRFRVLRVEGETRRGNLRVTLEVERA